MRNIVKIVEDNSVYNITWCLGTDESIPTHLVHGFLVNTIRNCFKFET
jgi:hypothetical protein